MAWLTDALERIMVAGLTEARRTSSSDCCPGPGKAERLAAAVQA
jgi:hypothetical protein